MGPRPDPDEDGYTGYERRNIRLELAFLACDEAGTVYTPLVEGRGDWPAGSFGDTQAEVDGVRPGSSVSHRSSRTSPAHGTTRPCSRRTVPTSRS